MWQGHYGKQVETISPFFKKIWCFFFPQELKCFPTHKHFIKEKIVHSSPHGSFFYMTQDIKG